MPSDTQSFVDTLKERLNELRDYIREDPLSNPVRQVAHELSVQLEAGDITLDQISDLIRHLGRNAFENRLQNLKDYLGISDNTHLDETLAAFVRQESSKFETYEAFAEYWEKRRDVIVFTAHPTFVQTQRQQELLSTLVTTDGSDPSLAYETIHHDTNENISLAYEHEAVLRALKNATHAISRLNKLLVEEAQKRFPSQWKAFSPSPVSLATWVGYDMDGRNDIGWQEVILHRLKEKLYRLQWYKEKLQAFDTSTSAHLLSCASILDKAIAHTEETLDLFSKKDLTAEQLSQAADFLTGSQDKLTDCQQLLSLLGRAIQEANDNTAMNLAALKADISTFRLGVGEIHFRLNAAQIRNAARHALDLKSDEDLFGRQALDRVQALIQNTSRPLEVNFASLAIEKTSAARLMIAMAQTLKHIDSDQPIRLLIAELENPVTVLAAVYLARLFGVDEKVDVCPLFETGRALDRSRRILDVLLQQPAFSTYARKRGRVAIQAGFSDAGRFMGQIPATLAIERLQGHFADLLHRHGYNQIEAIVFNTHGESMGRGNHQKSFTDRSLYTLSPWARQKFADHGIPLIHESSFQGGDGYVLFGTEELARSVLFGLLSTHRIAANISSRNDPFYEDISTSLDFFRTAKARQEALFSDKAYHSTLSALGLSLLPVTGSRKSKRQFERSSDDDASLRKIRAIPHNAILQQTGQLANLTAGIGQALSSEHDYFVSLAAQSDRFARLMSLVARARQLSDLKTMITYMKVFDGSFWATRPISGKEPALEGACAELADALSSDNRYFSALQLAARLRSDSIALTRILTDMDLREEKESTPTDLDLLHAVRVAIIQHLFLTAAKLPAFSPHSGHTKSDIMEMIFSLHVEEAHDLLCDIFPIDAPSLDDFKLKEPADYPKDGTPKYGQIREELIEPLKTCQLLLWRITREISHFYGAIG